MKVFFGLIFVILTAPVLFLMPELILGIPIIGACIASFCGYFLVKSK